MTMGWMIQGFNPGKDKKFFSSPKHPDWLWDPHSPTFNGHKGPLMEAKQPEHEVDHSAPSSAKVKNE
jgi:hypothetical protein